MSGESDREDVKVAFGMQLKRYREAAGLTQALLASFMDAHAGYITRVEGGKIAMTLTNLDKYARFFGVTYYQMGNPDHPVPTWDELPQPTKRKITEAKAAIALLAQEEKVVYRDRTINAKRLHGLLAEGYFSVPRVSREIFRKLCPDIPESEYPNQKRNIAKISDTLSKGKFAKLLEKLEPEAGSIAVRFVEKG